MVTRFIRDFSAIILLVSVQSPAFASCGNPQPSDVGYAFPSLNGRLVYSSYMNLGDGLGQLWLLDFATMQLQQISNSSWGLTDPLNAVFTLDGKWVLFTGVQHHAHNLFIFKIGSSDIPINLTNSYGLTRYEDIKISPDGAQIVYKLLDNSSNYYIQEAPLIWSNGVPYLGNAQTLVGPSQDQVSMPFLAPDSSTLYYTLIPVTAPPSTEYNYQTIWNQPLNPAGTAYQDGGRIGNPAFYPVVRNDYSVLFTKSVNPNLPQIVIRSPVASSATLAPFNDSTSQTSDAWPIDGTNYVFYTSNVAGPFNLYLGDIKTGQCWALDGFGVNADTTQGKFGPSYR